MIEPTIGRVVHVWNRQGVAERHQPEPALITLVHDDKAYINVGGFNSLGTPFSAVRIPLWDGEDSPPHGVHAAWMPYQIAVAKGEIPPVLHATPEPEAATEPDKPYVEQ